MLVDIYSPHTEVNLDFNEILGLTYISSQHSEVNVNLECLG